MNMIIALINLLRRHIIQQNMQGILPIIYYNEKNFEYLYLGFSIVWDRPLWFWTLHLTSEW